MYKQPVHLSILLSFLGVNQLLTWAWFLAAVTQSWQWFFILSVPLALSCAACAPMVLTWTSPEPLPPPQFQGSLNSPVS